MWGHRLLVASILTLPFQQAFTLSVGFPLKASEVLAIAGVVVTIASNPGRVLRIRGRFILAGLLFVTLLSSAWNLFTEPFGETSEAYPMGLGLDILQYTGYAGLAILYFACLSTVNSRRLMWALSWAVRLAAAYCVLQVVIWSLDLNAITHAINGNIQIGSQYGIDLPRNGPMREGNYTGFFGAAATFLMVRYKDAIGCLCGVFLIFYSQSTGAIVGVVGALVAGVILRPRLRKFIVSAIATAVIAGVVLLVPALRHLATGQLIKLGLIQNTRGTSYGYSLRARTVSSETGFSIAFDHPIFGVGAGRYGYHFWDYIDMTGLPSHYGRALTRPIANNAYAQIAAESGLVALCVFGALLVFIIWKSRKDSAMLLGAVVSMSIGIIAFPAWTVLSLWGLLGIVLSAISNGDHDNLASEPHGVPSTRAEWRRNERPRKWSLGLKPR